MEQEPIISRRGILIVSYQLEGICSALRLIMQCGAEPGDGTIALLQKLQQDVTSLLKSGNHLEGIPKVSPGMSAPELFAIAEVLRMSQVCFLTPDETRERKQAIGFSSDQQ